LFAQDNFSFERTEKIQEEKLSDVRQEIARIEPEFDSLQERKDLLTREKDNLSERLVIITEKIRTTEERITQLASDIKTADMQEQAVTIDLSSRKSEISKIIAAMGRLTLSPKTPLGLVEDEEKTLHTAITLKYITKELNQKSEELKKDLTYLRNLREQLKKDRRELSQEQDTLDIDSERLKVLLETRQESIERTDSELISTRKRLALLSEQEKTIAGLIDKIDIEKKQQEYQDKHEKERMIQNAKEMASQSSEANDSSAIQQQNIRLSQSKNRSHHVKLYSDSQFNQMKGKLTRPVSGKVIYAFGKPDKTGKISDGITMQSKAASIVTSPANAEVYYAGEFKPYGNIVILHPAGKYFITITGLGIINVSPNQVVAMGEPIGRLPAGVGDRNLFVEVRNSNKKLNPLDWFANSSRRYLASSR
jgi:septal ring factor EnvC (AmiA/AmiB activator)